MTAVLFAALLASARPGFASLNDSASHPPPSSAPYPYSPPGNWLPGQPGFLPAGQSYNDPVFGNAITRLTNVYPATGDGSNPYAKNDYWNSDGTLHVFEGGAMNVKTRAIARNVPTNAGDAGFDPANADAWLYVSGSQLRQVLISNGSDSLIKNFGVTLGSLGGSVDKADRTGRYFVLDIGGAYRIWDRQTDTLYSGSIANNTGGGWAGLTPDGNYLVIATNLKMSYRIDHAAKALNTTGTMFWSLCGDHGDLLSASDGKNYLVTFECHSEGAIYRVDITLPQSTGNLPKQRSDNRKLVDTDWSDDGHFSCVPRGPNRDWCLIDTESIDDTSTSQGTWRPFKSEIFMANVLTGEVRRLAHHRSRNVPSLYCSDPRINVNWDGTQAVFMSNYGATGVGGSCGYGDLYLLDLGMQAADNNPPQRPKNLRTW
ncbi:MAG: hypothetical protein AAB036_10220 [Elusimicrobiota bacterium]